MFDRFDVAASYLARILSRQDGPAAQSEMDAWEEAAPENSQALEKVFAAWDIAGSAQDNPEIQQMLADMRERTQARPTGWLNAVSKNRAIAAGLAILLPLSVMIWLEHRGGANRSGSEVQTAAISHDPTILSSGKERRTVRLPDGSRITLDQNSRLKLAYTARERGIALEHGRAHFAVHKDASRPFVVSAGRLTATAVGTAFDVSLSPKGEDVMTSEGTVRVVTRFPARDGSRATLLSAGMKLTQRANAVELTAVDVMQETAWTDGKIIFSSHCLMDVAQQMNGHGASALLVEPDAGRIAISGVFDLNNAEGLARALEQQGLTTMRYDGRRIILSRASAIRSTDCRTMN